uniref:Uncharacterized protein n=1 Tax=Spodoptera frugiperda nuclear polyhedrosis virus TaxID=10455 RepID=A0A7G3W816_NPVSF|nr:hypothetical protein [Spodoptera frugiperda multiple nucleopolyhedrovirus]
MDVEFAKKKLARKIKKCINIYYDEDDDEDPEEYCCVRCNVKEIRIATNKYYMKKLLRTCERWFKKLHREIKCQKQFVETFVASLPTDVFVYLDDIVVEKADYCFNCETKCKRYPGVNGDDLYIDYGFISLASCFCHVCGNEVLFSEYHDTFSIVHCKCETDFVVFEGLHEFYCLGCGNEKKDDDDDSDDEEDEEEEKKEEKKEENVFEKLIIAFF